MSFYTELAIAVGFTIFLYVNKVETFSSLYGIYRENRNKFFHIKYFLFFFFLKICKRNGDKSNSDKDISSQNVLPLQDKIYESLTFCGSGSSGSVFSCGLTKYPKKNPGYKVVLKVKKFGPELLFNPSEDLYNNESVNIPLTIEPIKELSHTWRITFDGHMRSTISSGKLLNVKIDVIWKSVLNVFNYNKYLSRHALCKSLSNEYWDCDYLKQIKFSHQYFCEQHGEVTGKVYINGDMYEIFTNSVKSHTIGKHNLLSRIYRLVMHYITLDSGDRISVGVACMPLTFSNIELGFVSCVRSSRNIPVESCDLKLYKHGDKGIPPKNYSFAFTAGKKCYRVKVHGFNTQTNLDVEAGFKIRDLDCSFDVNGVSGWGTSRWCYRV